jgi:hypothetical protein
MRYLSPTKDVHERLDKVRIPGQGDRDSEDIPIRIPKLI